MQHLNGQMILQFEQKCMCSSGSALKTFVVNSPTYVTMMYLNSYMGSFIYRAHEFISTLLLIAVTKKQLFVDGYLNFDSSLNLKDFINATVIFTTVGAMTAT